MQIPADENKYKPLYKAYIEKGNNNLLIRTIIKERWWRIIGDSKDDCSINLYWTQLLKKNIL